jgi:hypothetical protein
MQKIMEKEERQLEQKISVSGLLHYYYSCNQLPLQAYLLGRYHLRFVLFFLKAVAEDEQKRELLEHIIWRKYNLVENRIEKEKVKKEPAITRDGREV